MKLISQLGILLLLYFIGEFIVFILHLNIPGSIIGMLLLLVFLQMRIIKIEAIKEVATFLINNMILLFVPLGVGLMSQWELISKEWLPIVISNILSTFVVLFGVGIFLKKKKK